MCSGCDLAQRSGRSGRMALVSVGLSAGSLRRMCPYTNCTPFGMIATSVNTARDTTRSSTVHQCRRQYQACSSVMLWEYPDTADALRCEAIMQHFYHRITYNPVVVSVTIAVTLMGLLIWPFAPTAALVLLFVAAVGTGICLWRQGVVISRKLYSREKARTDGTTGVAGGADNVAGGDPREHPHP